MRKRNSILVLALLLGLVGSSSAAQKSIDGHWEGVMVREGADLTVSFDFTSATGGLAASFNSPTQRAIGIPLRAASYTAPKVHFELAGDSTTIIFDGEVKADAIAGQFREGDAKGTFSLTRAEAEPLTFRQEELSFQNRDVILSGTLLLPLTRGPHPAVVFLHGSGPEGRYASRFLAQYLTHYGIAALIYDKRGVGKSTGNWKQSDFDALADDSISGIHMLQQRSDINSKEIGIYGHSQGGSIAPLVASKSREVAFVISAAGGGVPMYEAEVNSLTNQTREKGISGNDLAEAVAYINILVNVARTGEGWDQLDAATKKAQNSKWLESLRPPGKDYYWWSFFRQIADYNPSLYWKKVSVPVLLIYGERDILVPVGPSIANIERSLQNGRNRDYTILILPRASHGLSINPEPGQPFEWWHMASGFPDLLTAWIKQRMK
jgi:dipeptidyl aminopeptidase/acylaminoacyl peptidase